MFERDGSVQLALLFIILVLTVGKIVYDVYLDSMGPAVETSYLFFDDVGR